MTKRILLVSIAFPPKADPECIQTARYYYYMSRASNVVIDVVTSKIPTLFMPADPTLARFSHVNGQLIEVPVYESKYVNYLVRKMRLDLIVRPDSKMTFYWQWRSVVKKLRETPDVIYSRSNPLSSAVMAMKLSRRLNRPWILHLSDPWTENVLCHYSPAEFRWHQKMEAECFGQASVISFTSDQTVRLYEKKYPQWASKMKVFPNVFDPNDPDPAGVNAVSGKKRIVYTGGLANTRTAQTLLEALKIVMSRNPLLSGRLEMIFAGESDRRNDEIFAQHNFPFLSRLGRVPFATASGLQSSADLLVVIDSVIADAAKAVFLPSKVLDYARLRKPVLAITTPGSATDDFVGRHGGVCFGHDRIEELADWLQSYLEGHIEMRPREIDNFFAADNQAAKLLELVQTIGV